jgi:predicted transport protein
MRYRRFGSDLLALELVHRTSASEVLTEDEGGEAEAKGNKKPTDKPVGQVIAELDTPMRDLFEAVRSHLRALGEDVQEKELKLYLAYRRIKNFASMVVQKKQVILYLKLDPDTVTIDKTYMRDVRNIGHWATGDLEVVLKNEMDFRNAQPLIQRAYEGA